MTSQSLGGHAPRRDATRRFHWLQVNAIRIISNSARYAARVLQDLYNSFIIVLLQLCGALYTGQVKLCDPIVTHKRSEVKVTARRNRRSVYVCVCC